MKIDIDNVLAGVGMDKLIAERVMGWTNVYQDGVNLKGTEPSGEDQTAHVPLYSVNISAAWRVVEKCNLLHGWVSLGYDEGDKEWMIFESRPPDGIYTISTGDTAPLAICRAALKAVQND